MRVGGWAQPLVRGPSRSGRTVGVHTDLFSHSVQHVLGLARIFVFAISGALLAVRKNLDVFGLAVLAEVSALGGGLIRL